MQKKTVSLSFIIIFILFLGFGVVEYYLILHKKPQNSSANLEKEKGINTSASPIPTGTGNIQNPASWSRYIYNKDFSIVYPPFWNVVVDEDGNGVSFMTTGFHQDDDFSMPYGNSYDVSYTIFGQKDKSDMQLQDGDQFPSDTTSETMVVTNLSHIQIAGYPAVEFDYYPTDNKSFLHSRIAILKGNRMYRFTATYAQDANKQLFEEMMQSLKFIQA